ncbi:MAG: hypothetical protein ACRC0G_05895 [Fusobacteriaceae bacterium]
MKQVLKLVKVGTSIGLIIRKDILAKLNKTPGDYVEIDIKEEDKNETK